MDIQFFMVGMIIVVASLYIGKQIYLKLKSTTSKSSCGSDCGCDAVSTKKMSPVQIKRTAKN
jgi:hypothetical protein